MKIRLNAFAAAFAALVISGLLPLFIPVGFATSATSATAGQQGGTPNSNDTVTHRSIKPQQGPAGEPAEPDPVPSGNISIRGRIIAPSTRDYPGVVVRVETDGGQPVGVAYTTSTGEFSFQTSGFSAEQDFYINVNMDGYKTFRDRVNGGFNFANGYSGNATVFLEPEDVKAPDKTGGTIVDLKELRARVPAKALDEYARALKEALKGDADNAIGRLQRVVKLAPDFYEAQITLGTQYMKMQKFQDAETALMRAKDLSPKAAEPVLNLGKLYYQRAQEQADAGTSNEASAAFRKALQFLEETVRRDPLSAPAKSYLGAALYQTGSYDEAESTLNHALELDDQESDAHLMLINVYVKQTHYDKALVSIKTFLTKNPKAPQRASLEGMQAQLEKALNKQGRE